MRVLAEEGFSTPKNILSVYRRIRYRGNRCRNWYEVGGKMPVLWLINYECSHYSTTVGAHCVCPNFGQPRIYADIENSGIFSWMIHRKAGTRSVPLRVFAVQECHDRPTQSGHNAPPQFYSVYQRWGISSVDTHLNRKDGCSRPSFGMGRIKRIINYLVRAIRSWRVTRITTMQSRPKPTTMGMPTSSAKPVVGRAVAVTAASN
jgi:hypothetical protein